MARCLNFWANVRHKFDQQFYPFLRAPLWEVELLEEFVISWKGVLWGMI